MKLLYAQVDPIQWSSRIQSARKTIRGASGRSILDTLRELRESLIEGRGIIYPGCSGKDDSISLFMDMASKENLPGLISKIWEWVTETLDSRSRLDDSAAEALLDVLVLSVDLLSTRQVGVKDLRIASLKQPLKDRFVKLTLKFQTCDFLQPVFAVVSRLKTRLMPALPGKEAEMITLLSRVGLHVSTAHILCRGLIKRCHPELFRQSLCSLVLFCYLLCSECPCLVPILLRST